MQTGRERETTDDQLQEAHFAKDIIFVGLRQRMVEERTEGLTAAVQFYALAA
jgi:hypothetical protein